MLTKTKIVRRRVEIPIEQVLEEKRLREEEIQREKEEAARKEKERRDREKKEREERQRKKREVCSIYYYLCPRLRQRGIGVFGYCFYYLG